ncbi:MAG: hypothetical protein IPM51_10600 [Sphingobacteriaceae bacterium]|nr:hypothetical protein [Sphingobacteriaceae bacterium]
MNPFLEFLICDDAQLYSYKAMQKQFSNIIKSIKPSILKSLPQLQLNGIYISDSVFANSGDVIIRSMDLSSLDKRIEHYGIVYGTTTVGEKLIFDMSPQTNVIYKTLDDFMDGFFEITIKSKPSGTSFEEILKRIEEWEYESYCFYDKNCQQFANYCVFGEKFSPGIEFVKELSLPLVDLRLSIWLNRKNNPENSKYLDLINNRIKCLSKLKSELIKK